MQELTAGRRSRLSRVIEILEGCHELGEQLNVELVDEVLTALEAELDAAAAGIPQGARELLPEEYRVALMLTAVGGALEDGIAYLEAHSRFHKFRNELMRIRDQLARAIFQGMLARLPKDGRLELAIEATAWGYVLLSPADKDGILQVLGDVAGGGRVLKATRAQAGELLRKLQGLNAKPRGKAGQAEGGSHADSRSTATG